MQERNGQPATQPSPLNDAHTTHCDWCGQKDHDPIKPQDGQVSA